jgi:hypothetical protein
MSTSPPGGGATPDATGQPSSSALLIQRHLSAPRLPTNVRATGGDLDHAVELYLWNAAVAGALWEVLGHVEVVVRNVLHHALTVRHQRLGRAGQWYDDPARELAQHARDDIARAKQRLQRAPVARLHVLRNRVAHHEPLLAEPLPDRYTDLLDVVGFVHPQRRSWLGTHNRLLATLAQRSPTEPEQRATPARRTGVLQ